MKELVLLCLLQVICVFSTEKVFYYGAPLRTSITGFIKLDPSSGASEPAAIGFPSTEQYEFTGIALPKNGNGAFIYGGFQIWNNSYIGNLLRFDVETMTPSFFNSGLLGRLIGDITFFDNDQQIAIIGNFMGFQQNPSSIVNAVGTCTVDGTSCVPLANGFTDYFEFGSLRSIDEYIFALYITQSSFQKVEVYSTTLQAEWKELYSSGKTTFNPRFTMEIFQGTIWLFGQIAASGGLSVGAARLNFDDFSWDFITTSSVPNVATWLSVATSVSPDGQSVYLISYYESNATLFQWNNSTQNWNSVLNFTYVQQPSIVATNSYVLFGENDLKIFSPSYGVQQLPNINCSGYWKSLTVSHDNSTLYAFCYISNKKTESYSYDLPSQSTKLACSINGLQQISYVLRDMCAYGPKLLVAGEYDHIGGIQASGGALWNSNYQKWYRLVNDSYLLADCCCGSDGQQAATACLVSSDPSLQPPYEVILVMDSAQSDSGNSEVAQNMQVYNLSGLGTVNGLTQVTIQNNFVWIVTQERGNGIFVLSKWSLQNGLETVLKLSAMSLKFAIYGDIMYLGGIFATNGTISQNNYVSTARYNITSNTTLDMDQVWILTNGNLSYAFMTQIKYWPFKNMIYVSGVMTQIGDLKVQNWGGLNLDGTAEDSVSGGVQAWVMLIEPVGERMYLVSRVDGCTSVLQNGCGSLYYYDATTSSYSNKITQGVSALTSVDDTTVPSDSSSSSGSKSWQAVMIMAIVIPATLILVLGIALVVYRSRKTGGPKYHEIPEMFSTDQSLNPIDFQHDDFVLKSVLGRGAYGTVWSCVFPNREAGTYAVKQMLFSKGDTKKIEIVKQEIDILEKYRHPNIVHYCGHRMESTQTSVEFFIFMELYEQPGSLKGVIQKKMKQAEKTGKRHWFTYPEIRKFLTQIAEGLHYLHLNGVAHRDLKCANILVRIKDGNVTSLHIADFGISRIMLPEDGAANILASTVLGTPSFMAPEVLSSQKYDAFKADIWSFGMMMFEMISWSENPVPGKKPQFDEQVVNFMNQDSGFQGVVEIFDKCAQHEPNSRPTASDLLFLIESLA